MSTVLALSDLRRLGWEAALVPIMPGRKRPGVPGASANSWQSRTWAPAELNAAEARGCSFGVRFNLPALPAAALDCDAENATADAAPIVADVARHLIGEGARRGREGVPRFVNVYRTAAIGDGKRAARFQRGSDSFSIELFNGSGQVLFGPKHESGAAYLWDSPPDYAALPVVAVDGPTFFAELAQALKPLGYVLAGTVHYGNADALERDSAKRADDPLWQALSVARGVLFEQRDGRAAIRCPFAAEHASAKGKRPKRDSSTAYLPPPAEGGNGVGFVSCLHASCAGRSQADFAAALGVELPTDPVIEFPESRPFPQIPTSPSSGGYEETGPPAAARKPAPMAAEAFRGPLGAAAELFVASCEASRENLLAQTLVTFSAVPERAGVAIGRARAAGCALQALIVGPTALARKGTALSFAVRLLEEAFPAFVRGGAVDADALTVPAPSRILHGLSSGEGLVFTIRDARQNGKDFDPGVPDKRLLVLLEEFGALLKVASREGNTLSELFRQVHDGGALSVPTRREPLYAARSHVAAVAHCTPAELTRRLDALELVNGMLNRWLIFYVERARVDAAPPAVDGTRLATIAAELRARLTPYAFAPGAAWQAQTLPLTPSAAVLWRDELYSTLNGGSAAGIAGGLNVRFAAYAKRLALLYALADGVPAIAPEHLSAAVAVLAYCEESMAYLFGTETHADPFTQRVADLIREGQGALVPRGALWKGLGHSVSAARIDVAISKLHEAGAVRVLRGPQAPNGVRPWAYAWRDK